MKYKITVVDNTDKFLGIPFELILARLDDEIIDDINSKDLDIINVEKIEAYTREPLP